MKGLLQKYSWLIIPLLFLLYSAPGVLEFVFYFPDEKHYSDAALQMIETGDYWTPFKADGSPRFLKPIATYWAVAGGYQIFGVSTISSRFFFWLAGAMLVMAVFFMVKSITHERKTAQLAAFITAANPLVILSAGRSIPDILLVLFLTISAWGFLEIMLAEIPSKKYYWFAWMGAALAFETKGIPAAGFAGASILFLLINPWKRKKMRQILEPVSLVASAVVALGWFGIMYLEHGVDYLSSFYADQVGERVSSKVLLVLQNAILGILTLVAVSLPWIVFVFSKPNQLKSFLKEQDSKFQTIFGFIAVWVIMIILMSGAVFKFYDRYLLPVIPLLSIFFALVLVHSETRFKQGVQRLVIFLNLTLLTVNVIVILFITAKFMLVASAIYISFMLGTRFLKETTKELTIAHSILLLFFNAFILLNAMVLPNPGDQLAQAIEKEHIPNNKEIYVYGSFSLASNIRIHGKNKLQVVGKNDDYSLPEKPGHLLVFSSKDKAHLDLNGYEIIKAAEELPKIQPGKFPVFLQPAIHKLKENGKEYFIGKPK